MTFTVKKKLGLNYLFHDPTLTEYGLFIGKLDLLLLNSIYKNIESIESKNMNLDEIEKNIREALARINTYNISSQDRYFIQEYLSVLDNPYSRELSLYKYYLTDLSRAAVCAYSLEVLRLHLPKVWFKNFIPVIDISQLNNNPYANVHPFDDPQIQWKVSAQGCVSRTIRYLFHRYIVEYKLI